MELQEPSLLGLIGQLRYQLRPRFADVRGAFIEELTGELKLPHWGWGDEAITLQDEERTLTLFATARELRAQVSRVTDLAEVTRMVTTLFNLGLERFAVEEVEFIGARTLWGAPVDSFDDLSAALVEQLGSGGFRELLGAVGRPVSDVGWVVEFHREDPKHALRVGPMTREQAVAQNIPEAKLEDLPESFLFFDLDRSFNDKPFPSGEAVDRWTKALDKNLEIASGLGKILTGTGAVR
jgi:hypothetical protein